MTNPEVFGMEYAPMAVVATVGQVLKSDRPDPVVSHDELEDQALAARDALTRVEEDTPGTCVEDRLRVGLLSGEAKVEARQSVPGGPNIYGLYIAELTNYFGDNPATGKQRLASVTQAINHRKIASGGHEGCAANEGIGAVLGLIAGSDAEAGKAYAADQLDGDYDEAAANEAIANAQKAVESGRYDDWTGQELKEVLGDAAGTAIETLVPGAKHTATSVVRSNIPGQTVDQNKLDGKSFVNDEDYAAKIENALAEGPQAEWGLKVARHARELLLHALVVALPNDELHQINIQ